MGRENKMVVVLAEKYTEDIKNLQGAMGQWGIEMQISVLEDNCFLPEGITSPYEYFVSKQNRKVHEVGGLSYNFLEIPKYWELRLNGNTAGIYEMGQKRAAVYFAEPVEKGIVQSVEWHMENGWAYKIDYYNKYGVKYASEFLDADNKVESKVYYSGQNQEAIVIQPQNNVVTLLENGRVIALFNSFYQYIEHYYIREIKKKDRTMLFLEDEGQRNLLEMDGNGIGIWDAVVFSEKGLLEKYADVGTENCCIFYAMPEQYPKNNASANALILTATDQIEQIGNLVVELPEVSFHIAAHTQMSDGLYRLAERGNVRIYPGISEESLEGLWETCDFYLDINHYREVDDVVNRASQENLLVMGFQNTLHHRELVIDECIYAPQAYAEMALLIKSIVNGTEAMQKLLLMQQEKRKEAASVLQKLTESLK